MIPRSYGQIGTPGSFAENGIPGELISIIGSVLMNFMWYHLMNAFGLI